MDTKVCKQCGRKLPATLEYFAPEKRGRFGIKTICRECRKAYFVAYNAAHREERRAYNAAWYTDHREEANEASRRWYEDNREYALALSAKWRATPGNLDRMRCHTANWRARQYGQSETITLADLAAVRAAQGSACRYCGRPLPDDYHVDHMTAFANGGRNVQANLALACPGCNHRKWTKTPEEFAPAHD